MILDIEIYLPYLDECDLSRAEKEEMIRTVWFFMESQVEKAFGSHPVQQVHEFQKANAKVKVLQNPVIPIDSNVISISNHFSGSSKTAANDEWATQTQKRKSQS